MSLRKLKYISSDIFLIIGMLCTIFITNSTGPLLLGISEINTVQSLFVIIYIIVKFKKNYVSLAYNGREYSLLLLAFLASSILLLHGSSVVMSFKYIFFMFIMPVLLLLCIKYATAQTKQILRLIVILFLLIECSLAIYEKLTMNVLFPPLQEANYAQIDLISFRSKALLGHPLMNANVVVLVYSFVIINLKKKLHFYLLSTLVFLALASFDARGATMMFLLIFSLFYGSRFIKTSRYKITYVIIFITVGVYLLSYFSQLDIAGRLFHRDELMDGSAQTRLMFLYQMKELYIEDIIFGFPHRTNFMYMGNGLVNENGMFLFVGHWGLPMLLLYIHMYYKLISYYFKGAMKLDVLIIFLSSFGIAAMNPNFTSTTIVTYLVICLALFSPLVTNPVQYIGENVVCKRAYYK